jgi:hypothetical protein
MKKLCSVNGCTRPHEARGFCKPHYKQSLYASNPDKIIARSKARYWGNLERSRAEARDKRLGLGASNHFELQKQEQGNVCAICKLRPPRGLDHNHTTGQWRGALCAACNSGLGDFGEDISRLFSAMTYILKWSAVSK